MAKNPRVCKSGMLIPPLEQKRQEGADSRTCKATGENHSWYPVEESSPRHRDLYLLPSRLLMPTRGQRTRGPSWCCPYMSTFPGAELTGEGWKLDLEWVTWDYSAKLSRSLLWVKQGPWGKQSKPRGYCVKAPHATLRESKSFREE